MYHWRISYQSHFVSENGLISRIIEGSFSIGYYYCLASRTIETDKRIHSHIMYYRVYEEAL